MVVTVNTSKALPVNTPAVPGVSKNVEIVLARFKQLKDKKLPWLDQYQLAGEFVHLRKQEFQEEHMAGEFLTREIFDPAAPKAAKTAASTLMSLLWPSTKNRFKFFPPDSLKGESEEKEYYDKVSKITLRVMDDPKAGFSKSTGEYLLDQVVFGTSGVEGLKDKDTKVRYTPHGVSHMYIDEGKDGQVDTVYIERKTTNQKLVKTYGLDKVSEKTRKEFSDGKRDIEKVLIVAIEPRIDIVSGKSGNKNMPFRSLHIEKDTKHELRESGFEELPIKVTRFTKLLDETYGRSLAMDALPDILQSNALWESVMVAVEKSLDPPAGVYSDGVLGGGEIDTSAGAINVFNPSDQAKDRAPYFQLFTIGEFKQMAALLQTLNERITDHFLIDRLLDFNNETRMTATEATLRDRMRSATLGQIFSTQINSYFTPIIERTFNILLASGELGAMPGSKEALEPGAFIIPQTIADLMTSGQDVFDIEYFTPAMRIMQAEEAEGILRQAELVEKYAAMGITDALDVINPDENIIAFSNIVGAPNEGVRSKKEIKGRRDARDAQQEDLDQQEQVKTVGDATRNLGQSGFFPTTQGE